MGILITEKVVISVFSFGEHQEIRQSFNIQKPTSKKELKLPVGKDKFFVSEIGNPYTQGDEFDTNMYQEGDENG